MRGGKTTRPSGDEAPESTSAMKGARSMSAKTGPIGRPNGATPSGRAEASGPAVSTCFPRCSPQAAAMAFFTRSRYAVSGAGTLDPNLA